MYINFTISTRVYHPRVLGSGGIEEEPFELIYGGNKILFFANKTFSENFSVLDGLYVINSLVYCIGQCSSRIYGIEMCKEKK